MASMTVLPICPCLPRQVVWFFLYTYVAENGALLGKLSEHTPGQVCPTSPESDVSPGEIH